MSNTLKGILGLVVVAAGAISAGIYIKKILDTK